MVSPLCTHSTNCAIPVDRAPLTIAIPEQRRSPFGAAQVDSTWGTYTPRSLGGPRYAKAATHRASRQLCNTGRDQERQSDSSSEDRVDAAGRSGKHVRYVVEGRSNAALPPIFRVSPPSPPPRQRLHPSPLRKRPATGNAVARRERRRERHGCRAVGRRNAPASTWPLQIRVVRRPCRRERDRGGLRSPRRF